jgi:hypothetical protein
MNQRGFIQLSLMGWMAVGAAVIILGLSVSLKIQTARLDAKTAAFDSFVSTVAEKGRQAEIKARAQEKQDLAKKEKADADYKKLLAANSVLNKRLRDNASGSVLPSGEASAGSADKICFGRPDLDAALRRFTSGVAELVIEGQSAIDELNIAKKWATDR